MRRILLLFALSSAFLISNLAGNAAAPKPGSACPVLNQKVEVSGYRYTCVKSGKKLVWSSAVRIVIAQPSAKPTPSSTPTVAISPTPTPSNSPTTTPTKESTVTEGWLCDSTGPQTGKTASGETMYCTLGSDGKSSWRPAQSTNPMPSPSPTGGTTKSSGITFNAPCGTANELVLDSNGLTLICRNGKYGWPISTDAPPMPAGGWTSRPSWYPTLAQAINDLGAPTASCRANSVVFTQSVVPLDQLAPTIPYGAMIYDHVTPIDHAYLGLKVLSKASVTDDDFVPVFAPADGVVTEISTLGGSTKTLRVVIRHDCELYTVYMVLNKVSGVLANYSNQIQPGSILRPMVSIKAGQEFGRQRDNPLDFNTFDGKSWLSGFVNPFAFTTQDAPKPYTTDYLQYFTPALKSAYLDQLQKKGSTTSGKIDWDVAGTASGNWFLNGTRGYGGKNDSEYLNAISPVPGGSVDGKNGYSWSHLAIAPHEVDTSKWIFSIGWFTDPKGDFKQLLLVVEGSLPTPDKLTSANGLVTYKLVSYSASEPAGSPARVDGSKAPFAVGYTLNAYSTMGVVGLQMNSDGTLSVEINTAMTSASQFTGFTSAKRIYRR